MRTPIRAVTIRTTMILAICVVSTLSVWAFAIEPGSLRLEEHKLLLPNWPSSAQGMRLAILADLHTGSPFNGLDKLEEIVRKTNKARPDLILIPGDLVMTGVIGGRFVPPEVIAHTLKELRAPLGVYAVLGNHDRGLDADRIRHALDTAGIPTLEDQAIWVPFRHKALWLVGVNDFWTSRHNVGQALQQVTTNDPVLLFTHNPDVFPDIPKRVALTIAGHTHGGQVALPLLGRPIVPSHFGERYASGHIIEEGRHLFVSPGLGTSIIPVRFRVPPEISIVILEPTSDR